MHDFLYDFAKHYVNEFNFDVVWCKIIQIEAIGGDSVNIRGVLPLLFWKSSSHRQVEKQTKEKSSIVYQCKGLKSEDTG